MAELLNGNQQWVDNGGNPIVDGNIYIGIVNTEPVLNPKSIFSDRALTTALANPVSIDSNGFAVTKIWLSGRYSLRVENSEGVALIEELDNGEDPSSGQIPLSNVSGINDITASANPTIVLYIDKEIYTFQVVNENTTDAVTLNIDSIGAKPIKRNFSQDVGIGRFKAGQTVLVAWNEGEDYFELINQNLSVSLGTESASIASVLNVDLSDATGNQLTITGKEAIASLGTVIAGSVFKLQLPGVSAVSITSSSVANPTNILCAAVHGLTTGDYVYISGHSGSVPNINGIHPVTVVDTLNFTIPVNVGSGGTGGTMQAVPSFTYNATSMKLPGDEDLILPPDSDIEVVSLGSGNWKVIDVNPSDGAPFKDIFSAIVEVFTLSGTYNVPDSVTKVFVEACGGGGGGGAGGGGVFGGGGGGGGAYLKAIVSVTPGSSETITVGAAGTGGKTVGVDGTAGGDTAFGTKMTAGGGGLGTASGTGGSAGSGSTTGTLVTGLSLNGVGGTNVNGGNGAGKPDVRSGIGGSGGLPGNIVATDSPFSGGGGGGGFSTGTPQAGDGGAGYMIIIPVTN